MHGKRVLLVEDELLIRWIMSEALQDRGFEVIDATTGDEALDVLRRDTGIDVLFTDVQMPGRADGIVVASVARQLYPAMPIIITSGYADQLSTRIAALQPPPARFFAKPYDHAMVVETIATLAG